MTPQITKDTIIADILNAAPEAATLLRGMGMNCLGCAMATGETLGDACQAHGVDTDVILKQLADVTK